MSFIEILYWTMAFLWGCFNGYRKAKKLKPKYYIGLAFILGMIFFPISLGLYVKKEEENE